MRIDVPRRLRKKNRYPEISGEGIGLEFLLAQSGEGEQLRDAGQFYLACEDAGELGIKVCP